VAVLAVAHIRLGWEVPEVVRSLAVRVEDTATDSTVAAAEVDSIAAGEDLDSSSEVAQAAVDPSSAVAEAGTADNSLDSSVAADRKVAVVAEDSHLEGRESLIYDQYLAFSMRHRCDDRTYAIALEVAPAVDGRTFRRIRCVAGEDQARHRRWSGRRTEKYETRNKAAEGMRR
jgi:hypothetical protein